MPQGFLLVSAGGTRNLDPMIKSHVLTSRKEAASNQPHLRQLVRLQACRDYECSLALAGF